MADLHAAVNKDALKSYAGKLKKGNEQIETAGKQIKAGFKALKDKWRDKEYEIFAEEFQQTLNLLIKFKGRMDEHIRFLQRKAQRVDDYERERQRISASR